MSGRKERIPLKFAGCSPIESNEALILYNLDHGRRVAKPKYYVFEKDNFSEILAETQESGKDAVNIVVSVGKIAHSIEQVLDPEAPMPNTPEGSYVMAKVEKIM